MKVLFIPVIILLSGICCRAQSVPYTQDDRDRLVRLETKVEEMDKNLNAKIDKSEQNLNARIDKVEQNMNSKFETLRSEVTSKIDFLANLIIALIVVMFGFVGYMVWDRKTTLNPVKSEQDKLKDILREYAREKNDETLKKLLDRAAML